MLAYAVEVGTGENAQILPYWVAGKTGTAQKALPNGGGYSEDRYVASFVGFVPASRPELVVAVVLDEPVSRYGAVASAPTFQDVARFALGLFRIPPAAKPPIPPHAVPTG
jgi:cell division protein FtsI/penicillin-binding protein 2